MASGATAAAAVAAAVAAAAAAAAAAAVAIAGIGSPCAIRAMGGNDGAERRLRHSDR